MSMRERMAENTFLDEGQTELPFTDPVEF